MFKEEICNTIVFKTKKNLDCSLDKIVLKKERKELTVSTNKNKEFSANKTEGAF